MDVHPQLQAYISNSGIQTLFVNLLDDLLLSKPANPVLHVSLYLQQHFPHQLDPNYQGDGSVPFDSPAHSSEEEGGGDEPPPTAPTEWRPPDPGNYSDTDSEPEKGSEQGSEKGSERRPRRRPSLIQRVGSAIRRGSSDVKPWYDEEGAFAPTAAEDAAELGPEDPGAARFWRRSPFKPRRVPPARARRRKAITAGGFTNLQVVDALQRMDRGAVPKSEDEFDRVTRLVQRSELLRQLDEAQVAHLMAAASPRLLADGEVLVQEGDDPGGLFLLDDGVLHLSRAAGDGEVARTYRSGSVLFELAAFYAAPSPGTVVSAGNAALWFVSRANIRSTGFDVSTKRRSRRLALLTSVPVLGNLTDMELQSVADCFSEAQFADGDEVLRQGEPTDTLIIVQTGRAAVSMVDALQQRVDVDELVPGRFFGEEALLPGGTAAAFATITAREDFSVLSMDRNTFKRTLGPAADLLNREEGGLDAFVSRQRPK